jgi:hypothetical protein
MSCQVAGGNRCYECQCGNPAETYMFPRDVRSLSSACLGKYFCEHGEADGRVFAHPAGGKGFGADVDHAAQKRSRGEHGRAARKLLAGSGNDALELRLLTSGFICDMVSSIVFWG